MFDNLLRLYDETAQKLLQEDLGLEEIREILMKDFVATVLNMDKSEVPPDVREFMEIWYHRDDVIGDNEADEPSTEELSEVEMMQKHAKGHGEENNLLFAMYDWLLTSAPKSVPPTLIYFALCMYARYLYGSHLCLAETLFGSELPKHSHGEIPGEEHEEPGEGEEEEEDEDEPEEEEEDTGDAPK